MYLSRKYAFLLLAALYGVLSVSASAPCTSSAINIGGTCTIECGSLYEKCGGFGFTGAKCCKPGLTCIYRDLYYSQCRPESPPKPTGCVAPYGQCGGAGYNGPNCCTTGFVCEQQVIENQFYSQCVPSPEMGCPCASGKGYCKKDSPTIRKCTACAGVSVASETLECCPQGAVGYMPGTGATAGNGPLWELSPPLTATGRKFLQCKWKTLLPSPKFAASVEACPSDEASQHTDGTIAQQKSQLRTASYVGFRYCPPTNGYLHAATANLDVDLDPILAIEREGDNKCIAYDDDSNSSLSASVAAAVIKGQCYVVHLTTYRSTSTLLSGVSVWFDTIAPAPAPAPSPRPITFSTLPEKPI